MNQTIEVEKYEGHMITLAGDQMEYCIPSRFSITCINSINYECMHKSILFILVHQ